MSRSQESSDSDIGDAGTDPFGGGRDRWSRHPRGMLRTMYRASVRAAATMSSTQCAPCYDLLQQMGKHVGALPLSPQAHSQHNARSLPLNDEVPTWLSCIQAISGLDSSNVVPQAHRLSLLSAVPFRGAGKGLRAAGVKVLPFAAEGAGAAYQTRYWPSRSSSVILNKKRLAQPWSGGGAGPRAAGGRGVAV